MGERCKGLSGNTEVRACHLVDQTTGKSRVLQGLGYVRDGAINGEKDHSLFLRGLTVRSRPSAMLGNVYSAGMSLR